MLSPVIPMLYGILLSTIAIVNVYCIGAHANVAVNPSVTHNV